MMIGVDLSRNRRFSPIPPSASGPSGGAFTWIEFGRRHHRDNTAGMLPAGDRGREGKAKVAAYAERRDGIACTCIG